jgi:ElaB/YqjD/DUF883 family membrane-anchored ribosome-binding protein
MRRLPPIRVQLDGKSSGHELVLSGQTHPWTISREMRMATAKEREAELSASKEAVMDAYDKLQEAKSHFRLAAEAAGLELKEEATDQLRQGRKKVEDLSEQASGYMKEQPLATLIFAFIAGFILAHIFSRK